MYTTLTIPLLQILTLFTTLARTTPAPPAAGGGGGVVNVNVEVGVEVTPDNVNLFTNNRPTASPSPIPTPSPSPSIPPPPAQPLPHLPGCQPHEIRLRKAWHTLTPLEKHAYLSAEQCLMRLPSRTPHPHALTRFDDLQAAHARQVLLVHRSGWFLPWHRYFIYAHEEALRTECGYTGAQPYWDETGEAHRFLRSKMFTAAEFGSDGLLEEDGGETYHYEYHLPPLPGKNETNGCVPDGRFSEYVLRVGPTMDLHEPHCISRQLNESASQFAEQRRIDGCLSLEGFLDFSTCLELGPHLAGHFGTGGEMDNPISSPGDPVFYLHHAWLDRIFLQWQKGDGEGGRRREREVQGYASWVPVRYPGERESTFRNATLWDVLTTDGSARDVRLWEALGVTKGLMRCTAYVDPAFPPP